MVFQNNQHHASTALPPSTFEETAIPSPSSLFDLATTLLPFEGMLDPDNECNDVIGDLRDSGMLDDVDDQVTLLNGTSSNIYLVNCHTYYVCRPIFHFVIHNILLTF
jgi:hypothetical protein